MKKLDKYSYHEACDRAYVILELLENSLGEHPVLQQDTDAQAAYTKAHDSMYELYQLLANLDNSPKS